MRVLRRIDLDRAVVVRTVVSIPVLAFVARLRQAEQLRRTDPIVGVKHLQAAIGKRRIRHHPRAIPADHRMPSVERTDRAHGPSIDIDADDPVRPARRQQLALARMPGLVDDPLVPLARVRQPMIALPSRFTTHIRS